MKAVLCKSLGPPEALAVEEIAPPEAAPGEVVVEVRAVGLNFFDTLLIEGKYQLKPPLPFSPGGEIAGVVKQAGCGFAAGTRVMGFIGHGGAREEVAVKAERLAPLPEGLGFDAAAGLTIAYGTALHGLKDRGGLKAGESVAVLGAAGGVGQAAVEVAKALGARVIACASSADKLAFCRELGADALVDYSKADLKEALKALGVDVVFDVVGGSYAEPALRALNWGGRYLVVGFAAGGIPSFPLNLLLVKGLAAIGVYWGAHVEREPALHRANLEQIVAWAAAGRIAPHIHASYPLEEIAAALAAITRRDVKGKVILTL